MTILEIMIVLAIVGLMMLIGLPAVRSFVRTDLRGDAGQIAAMLRAGYELAALSGVHHRMVLDFDQGGFKLEACPEEMRLIAGDEEKLIDATVLETVPKARPETPGGLVAPGGPGALDVAATDDPTAAVAMSAALSGIKIGGARCVVPTAPNGDADARGNARRVRVDRGIKIARVHVQHLSKPVTSGTVAINFFALGWSEKALVELAVEGGDTFTVVVHGLTGRIEVSGDPVDADRHMRRDAAGDEAGRRE